MRGGRSGGDTLRLLQCGRSSEATEMAQRATADVAITYKEVCERPSEVIQNRVRASHARDG